MQPFESPRSAQQFLSTHSAIYNLLNTQRHLISRGSAKGEAGVGARERCQRTAAGHHLAPPKWRTISIVLEWSSMPVIGPRLRHDAECVGASLVGNPPAGIEPLKKGA